MQGTRTPGPIASGQQTGNPPILTSTLPPGPHIDDVIKVSGCRLGTAEIESALVSHPTVAEAAAIGIPHDVRGNVIHSFVILRSGWDAKPELASELIQHVGREVGPIAKPEQVE